MPTPSHPGLLSRLASGVAGAFSRKSAGPGGGGYTGGYNGGSVFTDAFRTRKAPSAFDLVEQFKTAAYACANLNANGVARIPLKLYATTARGQARPKAYTRKINARQRTRIKSSQWLSAIVAKSEEIDEVMEHPTLDALSHPNPDFDLNALLRHMVLSMDVVGTSFNLPEADGPGKWLIWPMLSQYVLPIRSTSQSLVSSYTYFGQTYEPDQLIRARHMSLRDPFGQGYAPLQAAFEFAGLGDKVVSVQENMLGSGFRPSVMVSLKDGQFPMGPPERARAEADFNTKWNGARAGKGFFLDGALDINPLTFPPADLGALDIQSSAEKVIAYCFGVPLSLLKTEDVNLANAEAGHRQHASLAIEPRCVAIASAFTKWLHNAGVTSRRNDARSNNWERLFFAFDDPIGEDQEREAKIFDMRLKNGSMIVNEVRELSNLDSVPWGDEPWLPTTLIQPSTAEANRQQAQVLAEQAAKQPEAVKPEPGEPKPKPEPDPSDSEKAVLDSVLSILKSLQEQDRTHREPPRTHRAWDSDGVSGEDEPAEDRPGGAGEHLRPPEGDEDLAGTEEVVPGPA